MRSREINDSSGGGEASGGLCGILEFQVFSFFGGGRGLLDWKKKKIFFNFSPLDKCLR